MPAKPPPAPAATASPDVSDDAVRRRTGRGWDEWFALLDAWGAAERTHTEIAAWVNETHGVEGWWAQNVTVGYERARGRRALGQLVDGFSASASKTIAVPVERLYQAVADPKLRARWLPGAPLAVTSASPTKAVHWRWEDDAVAAPSARGTQRTSRVDVGFTAKGDSKSQVALQHSRLRDADAAAQMKTYWRDRLTALQQLLEGGSQT